MRVLLICKLEILLCHFICECQNFKLGSLVYVLNYHLMAVQVQIYKVLLTL